MQHSAKSIIQKRRKLDCLKTRCQNPTLAFLQQYHSNGAIIRVVLASYGRRKSRQELYVAPWLERVTSTPKVESLTLFFYHKNCRRRHPNLFRVI